MSSRTSSPTVSVSSTGPTGWPYPRSIASSTARGSATPVSSIRIASTPWSAPSREVANPGASVTVTGSFPSPATNASARSRTASLVWSASTTSTRSIAWTGLKKWTPTARSGADNAAATLVSGSEEVFDATTASTGR